MYAYLIAIIIIIIALWSSIFFFKRNFRKPMLFTGLLYTITLVPLFWIHKLLLNFMDISPLYNPAYWTAETLFDLNSRTGGFSIEDMLFMFFAGGIVAVIYELISNKEVNTKTRLNGSYLPIIIFLVSYILISFTKINPIYLLIIPSFIGGISLIIIRKDLAKNAIISMLSFGLLYFIALLIFNSVFPDFIATHYNTSTISGIFILKIPLEEILYGLSFGLMWGPIYKLIKRIK